jgi:hypothetical protein
VAIKVPQNGFATNSGYGPGWSCDRGYRADGESCAIVEVPANAYLVGSAYGPGWTCERGFQEVSARCVAIEMPQHGHLDYSGNAWDCARPYRKQRDHCEPPLAAPKER